MTTTGATARVLVVLMADQYGSTALRRELGDLRFDEVRRAVRTVLAEAIDRAGGTWVKDTGDGALAVFESASAALKAATSVHKAAHRANQGDNLPGPITLRVGIAAGDVIWENHDCYGTPVVEAARLEAAAPAGGVLCTELTKALAGSMAEVEFGPAVQIEAKGFERPIDAREVRWPDEADTGTRVPLGLRGEDQWPFVGRGPERQTLQAAWNRANSGHTSCVMIAGEPGVGKSRLAKETARAALDDGAILLHGRCEESLGVPFQPFVETLRFFVDEIPAANELLGRYRGDLARILPDLRDQITDLPPALESDPESERFRLFDAVTEWLSAVSGRAPVLLVIDDIHWATLPTLQLLRHLLRRAPELRLLVLATYRDTEAELGNDRLTLVRDILRETNVDRLALEGLEAEAVDELVVRAAQNRVDESTTSLRDFVRTVHAQTAGNPFFVGSLLSSLVEAGQLVEGDDGWLVADPSQLEVPDRVHEVVADRLARLSPEANEILEVGAVIGARFPLDLVSPVLKRDRYAVSSDIDQALRARLVAEVENGAITYRFEHALVRSTIYDDLSLGRRAQHHHGVAVALEELSATDPSPWLRDLAHHYRQAGGADDLTRAVHYGKAAGDQALDQLAFDAAVDLYRSAWELAQRPECHTDITDRAQLLVALGIAEKRAGLRSARQTLLDAADLATEAGETNCLVTAALTNSRGFFSSAGATDSDRVRVLRAALDAIGDVPSVERARLLSVLSVELTFELPMADRLALSDQALALARQLNDPGCLAQVLNMRIVGMWDPRHVEVRLALCEELRNLGLDIGRSEWRYNAATQGFQAAMEAGQLDLADRCLAEMDELAAELGQPTADLYNDMRRCVRVIVGGDLERGERFAEEAHREAVALGQPDADTFFFAQLINIRFHQGRLEELHDLVVAAAHANPGLPVLQSAVLMLYAEHDRTDEARVVLQDLFSRWKSFDIELNWLTTIALMALGAHAVNDCEAAEALLPALDPYRDIFVDNATNWFGSVSWFTGLLEHTLGSYDDADQSFAHATERHRTLDTPLMAARTELDWGLSLLDRPEPDIERARPLLEAAAAAAHRHGLGTIARRATAALEGLGHP